MRMIVTMLTKILKINRKMWMNNFISPAKVIHTVGVVGRVEWRDLGGHDYSGIFKGAQHGLAR